MVEDSQRAVTYIQQQLHESNEHAVYSACQHKSLYALRLTTESEKKLKPKSLCDIRPKPKPESLCHFQPKTRVQYHEGTLYKNRQFQDSMRLLVETVTQKSMSLSTKTESAISPRNIIQRGPSFTRMGNLLTLEANNVIYERA